MGLKLGEFIDKDLECIPKLIKVLQYLNKGYELELGDYTYKIGETESVGLQPLFKMTVTSSDKTQRDEWFGYQGDINAFSTLCNSLSDDDVTLLCATITLNEINKI